MNHVTGGWCEHEGEVTLRQWSQGASAREIANNLHAMGYARSRNAVIGFINRKRTPKRPCDVREKKPTQPRQGRSFVVKHPRINEAPYMPPPEPIEPLNIAIADLREGQCRAPTDLSVWGRPCYCGHPVQDGSSYCPGHHAMFHQRAVDKKRG